MKKILLVILILGCTNSYGSETGCLAENVYFEHWLSLWCRHSKSFQILKRQVSFMRNPHMIVTFLEEKDLRLLWFCFVILTCFFSRNIVTIRFFLFITFYYESFQYTLEGLCCCFYDPLPCLASYQSSFYSYLPLPKSAGSLPSQFISAGKLVLYVRKIKMKRILEMKFKIVWLY